MNLPWLFAFGLTQLIEGPVYYRGLDLEGPSRPRVERALLALLPSALTHPLLWFALFPPVYQALFHSLGSPWGYWSAVVVCELIVVVFEALVFTALTRCRPIKGFGWAFGANLASVSIGLITTELFGWP